VPGVAVEHDPRVVRDAERFDLRLQAVERRQVVVARGERHRVHAPGAGDVPVTEAVGAHLEDDESRIARVRGEPRGGDEQVFAASGAVE
jgi:hypothetical protein